eukprot:m.680822 g.680822  ORF g.680822 m.680822 type:complete len:401 (+) comp58597_c2_seq3:1186-2388(+)
MVMEQVQKLARKSGKIVVCSIHQPRATIFQLFDRVMLMSRGQVTYFGPTPGALDAFAKVGFACPELENPADFVIDVIVRHEWANDFEPLDRLVLQAKEQFESEGIPVNTFAVQRRASKIREAEKSHGLQHYLTLTHRTFLATLRNPAATFVQLTQTIFIACLLGSIYYKLGHNQASIQDRSGLLFFIIMNQVFSYFPTISLFAENRVVFGRERASGLYETMPFFLAKVSVEIPFIFGFVAINACILYFMVDLQLDAGKFFLYYVASGVCGMVAISLFTFFGAFAKDIKVAQILAPISVTLFALVGGFYVNSDTLPNYFVWLTSISFIPYVYEILMKNEFTGLLFTCSGEPRCLNSGEQTLGLYGMEDVSVGENFAVLCGMIVGFLILGFVSVRFSSYEVR